MERGKPLTRKLLPFLVLLLIGVAGRAMAEDSPRYTFSKDTLFTAAGSVTWVPATDTVVASNMGGTGGRYETGSLSGKVFRASHLFVSITSLNPSNQGIQRVVGFVTLWVPTGHPAIRQVTSQAPLDEWCLVDSFKINLIVADTSRITGFASGNRKP